MDFYPFLLRSVRIVSQIYFAAKSDPPPYHERHIIFIGMAVTDMFYSLLDLNLKRIPFRDCINDRLVNLPD